MTQISEIKNYFDGLDRTQLRKELVNVDIHQSKFPEKRLGKKIRSSKSIYFSSIGFSLVFSLFYNLLVLIYKLFPSI